MQSNDERNRRTANGFAERLRLERTRAGLSLRALDRAAGLHVGHCARIERGRAPRFLRTAVALAAALRVRLDWLVAGKGTPRPDASPDRERVAALGGYADPRLTGDEAVAGQSVRNARAILAVVSRVASVPPQVATADAWLERASKALDHDRASGRLDRWRRAASALCISLALLLDVERAYLEVGKDAELARVIFSARFFVDEANVEIMALLAVARLSVRLRTPERAPAQVVDLAAWRRARGAAERA